MCCKVSSGITSADYQINIWFRLVDSRSPADCYHAGALRAHPSSKCLMNPDTSLSAFWVTSTASCPLMTRSTSVSSWLANSFTPFSMSCDHRRSLRTRRCGWEHQVRCWHRARC